MTEEQLTLAIEKMLDETEPVILPKRNRAWRQHYKVAKLDNLLKRTRYSHKYIFKSKWLDNPEWDIGWKYTRGMRQLTTVLHSGVRVKFARTAARKHWQRLAAKKVRRFKGFIPDGRTYQKFLPIQWMLI